MSIQFYFDIFRQCANTIHPSVHSASTTPWYRMDPNATFPRPSRIICAPFHSNLLSRLTPLFQYVGIRSRRIPHDASEKDDQTFIVTVLERAVDTNKSSVLRVSARIHSPTAIPPTASRCEAQQGDPILALPSNDTPITTVNQL